MIYSRNTKYSPMVEKQTVEFRMVILNYIKDPMLSHGGMYLGDIYDELYNDMRESVYNIERERYG
jgi:hypothetical protein